MEKELSECINIEQLIGTSIKHLSCTLDTLVGKTSRATRRQSQSLRDHSEDSIDDPSQDNNLLLMSSQQISQLYKDHFKYEFAEDELYQLLGV